MSARGVHSISFGRVIYLCILPVFFVALSSCSSFIPASLPQTIDTPAPVYSGVSVVALDKDGKQFEPLTEVVVRVSNSALVDSGEDGRLIVASCTSEQFIMAWAPGYEIGFMKCDGQTASYPIALIHLEAIDNPNYPWASATGECNLCHGNQFGIIDPTGASYDEINEWFKSGHGTVFDRGYFESMYKGMSVTGKASQSAQPIVIGNDLVPVPPDRNENYHGPGFKLDFPQEPGNCAYCHVPAAIPPSQGSVDLSTLFPRPGGVWGEGVTCDVCHKVFGVTLADNGFPFVDRPGILSFKFLRPDSGVFMIGPFSNILIKGPSLPPNHRSTCAPIFSRSEFCAACHFGKFGDMVIYNSYGEWKASPFAANPEDPRYRTCQDCHMSHMNVDETGSLWSQRQACSASDPNFQNFSHNMMDFGVDGNSGKEMPRMIKGAARIDMEFGYEPERANSLDVIVRVTNTKAGHKFPTDSPLRHLIMVVSAEDRVGTSLIQVAGERIPNWAGVPNSQMSAAGIEGYSGLPGKIFANLLVEEDTNIYPSAAYWNETKFAFVNPENGTTSDNRLRPAIEDTSTYSFSIPDAGHVKITVQLIYRFAFFDLMIQKEWFDRPDQDFRLRRQESTNARISEFCA